MADERFYGSDQAWIHHEHFGALARSAGDRVVELLRTSGFAHGTVVDLGCGSGILSRVVGDAGYEAVGIDLSPGMLEVARAHAPRAELRCEPVLDAVLPPAVAVTAIGEVLNYGHDARMLDIDLAAFFRRVHDALVPSGIFLFDVAGRGRVGAAKQRDVWHEHDDWTLFMRAHESDDGTRLDRHIAIFRRVDDGHYRRTIENHVLRLYEPAVLVPLLESAGFSVETRRDYGDESVDFMPITGWSVLVARRRA
jgi:SAM-dependent methyltransferase